MGAEKLLNEGQIKVHRLTKIAFMEWEQMKSIFQKSSQCDPFFSRGYNA